MTTFEENLQQARQAVNLTQEEVAEKLFVTRQTVSRWERGKTLPNIYMLKDLSELYETSIDSLASGIESRRKRKLNPLALAGIILLNLFLLISVGVTIVTVILSLWFSAIVVILSPVLSLIIPHFHFTENVGNGDVVLFIVIYIGTLILLYPLYLLTKVTWKGWKKYLAANIKAVYR